MNKVKAKAVRSRADGYATLWDTAGDQVGYVWKEEFSGASVWRLALYGPNRERKILIRFGTRKAAVEFAEKVLNRPAPKPLTEEQKAGLRQASEDIRRAFGGH